jgi:hypothetical protein
MRKAQVDATCIECQEGITNPICPECLAREMKSWKPSLRIWDTDVSYEHGKVRCIFCGKRMGICAHCFSKDMYSIIVEKYPELAEEFIDTFNYGLREELS